MWLSGCHILTVHSPLIDNQIRSTSFSIPVDDIRLIRFSDRRKLFSATGRSTVFPQKRSKICPCFPFAPGVPQGSAPAASGLEVCGRGRVDDHPDGMGAILLAKPEQLGDECSRPFGPFGSPQLSIDLKHGSQIVVEREPASGSKALSFQFSQVVNCLSKLLV